MWPAILAAAGASAAGGGLNAMYTRREREDSQNWAWEMDANKYRRAAYDMRAAGLNPILAAGGGFSVGSPSAPGGGNPGFNFGNTVSSALSAARLKKEMQLLDEQIFATRQSGFQASSQTQKNAMDAHVSENVAKQVEADTAMKKAQTFLYQMQGPESKAAADFWSNNGTEVLKGLKVLIDTIGGARKAVGK